MYWELGDDCHLVASHVFALLKGKLQHIRDESLSLLGTLKTAGLRAANYGLLMVRSLLGSSALSCK